MSKRSVAALGVALVLAACTAEANDAPAAPSPEALAKESASASGPDAATPPPADAAFDPAALGQRFGDAVWKVEVDGCDLLSSGSSFAIAPDLLVTNRHVVEYDVTPVLVSRDGSVELSGTVIGMSDEVDLAVVRVDGTLDVTLDWAVTSELVEGQQVVALGYPAPFETFSVTVGTLNAFDVVDGVRVGLISDEASDYGSSGGPLLTSAGTVAGIVTEFAGEGGRQVLGVSLTHDAVRDELARILADPSTPDIDCGVLDVGGDEVLDVLYEICGDGEMWACDELYERTDGAGAYGTFGASCGDLVDTDEWCTILYDTPEAFTSGDVASLDALWDGCASGTGEWAADCDLLYSLAPFGSDYEAFGDSCGRRNEPSGWCEELYPAA